ncbi:hypothetical protein HY639_01540 [Candidatus Woesearchaeota archaeon]|nr:hypothetical protein [Candidatus Woesearchaeota archaeon]
MEKTLEKVVKEKLTPIIAETTKKTIGVTVDELNKSLIDRIATTPFITLDVNAALPYRTAKRLFRKRFFAHLIETHYGNVSDVAKITGIDRRTIHRIIRELGIDVDKLRQHLLNPDHYMRIALDQTLRSTLEQYKPIIHPERLDKMYQQLPKLEEEVLASLPKTEMSYKEAEEEFDRQYLSKALKANNYNISQTARAIKLRYETLHRKLKALGLKDNSSKNKQASFF